MLAFKKYIQRPLLLFCILLLVATVVFFPVSAADNNIEFFDFDDYAKYSYNASTGLITADISLPASWCWSYARDGDGFMQWFNSFDFTTVEMWSPLIIDYNPFAKVAYDAVLGHAPASLGHFLDLQYIPSGAKLNVEFITQIDVSNSTSNFADIFLAYVDSTGRIISHLIVPTTLHVIDFGNNRFHYAVLGTHIFDSVPDNATGCFYLIHTSTIYSNGGQEIPIVNVKSSLVFNYSEQNYNIKQNQIIRDKVSNIDKQLGDLITGTPEQNEAVDGAVDQMQQAGDDLKDLGSSMSNVPKPDPGDINVSIDQFVSPGTMLAYTQPFLSLWDNPTMLAMLIIVMTLVLVSWVMFGKKGG